MFLSNFSIKQPVTTVAIVIVLMCLGLLAFKNLRVNQIPDVEQPVIVVNVPYPGASPETVEREIINRIEKSLQSIPQVYEIRSTASEGQARIIIIFNFKKNMSMASDEIRNAIAVGALQAAGGDARAGAVPRGPLGAADHAGGAVVDHADARGDLAPRRRRARGPLPRDRRRGDGQRQRLAAARAVRAAARAEAARVQRLRQRCGERAARAEHHGAGRSRQGRARRAEHPPRRPHRVAAGVRGHRSQAQWQRDRAPRPGGDHRGRRSPRSTATACAMARPNVGLSIARSRDASTVTVARPHARAW